MSDAAQATAAPVTVSNGAPPGPAPAPVGPSPGSILIDETHAAKAKASKAARLLAARAAEKATREAEAAPTEEAAPVAPKPKPAPAPTEEGEEPAAASAEEAPSTKDERAERVKNFLAGKKEKGELQSLRARMEAQAAEHKRAIEQARSEERQSLLSQFKKAPKELFQAHGVAADEVLAAAMEEATQDPVKLLERKYAALEAKLQQEAQERERLQQSLQEREQHAVVQQQQQAAIQAATDASKFPALAARYGDDHTALLSEMSKVANDYHARAGHWPTYADVAEYLDSREAAIFARYSGSATGARPQAAPLKKAPAKIGTGLSVRDAAQSSSTEPPRGTTHKERLQLARQAVALAEREAETRKT